jgi:hypothetical protein
VHEVNRKKIGFLILTLSTGCFSLIRMTMSSAQTKCPEQSYIQLATDLHSLEIDDISAKAAVEAARAGTISSTLTCYQGPGASTQSAGSFSISLFPKKSGIETYYLALLVHKNRPSLIRVVLYREFAKRLQQSDIIQLTDQLSSGDYQIQIALLLDNSCIVAISSSDQTPKEVMIPSPYSELIIDHAIAKSNIVTSLANDGKSAPFVTAFFKGGSDNQQRPKPKSWSTEVTHPDSKCSSKKISQIAKIYAEGQPAASRSLLRKSNLSKFLGEQP